ncbi:MAG: ABC transporter ATP-binding protein [Lachnospiraceae bacterium]|jgi:ABC-2 type transport system ATP-binding protein|nr:ABC transporter ATP-binding protein [Lachnospiraceae bacterium]
MLRLTNVKKTYPQFHLDCSLSVPENRVTALIGPNGAGKTTAFKAILGLISTEGGQIQLFGKPYSQITGKDQQQMGIALSDSGFSGYLQIRDILPVMAHLYPEFNKERFLESCQRFDLPLNKKIRGFSTGMKAKLKVLAALSHNAKLLILDEPTAGLDVLAREELLDMLRDYMVPGGRSVLISSHISSDLENFCDDFYMIDQGKILMHEETDTLLDCYGIIKVTEAQYETLDKTWLLRKKKESYGFSLLTAQRQFYQENVPELTIEKCTIDDVILMMIKGEIL